MAGSIVHILNAGRVESRLYTAIDEAVAAFIVNTGEISTGGAAISSTASTGDDYVFNSGVISGSDAILEYGAHNEKIVNEGQITATGLFGVAVCANSNDSTRLVNDGVISGEVQLSAAGSTIVNSGSINGVVSFGAGTGRVVNSGKIDGNVTFVGANNVYHGEGGSFTGTATGSSASDRLFGGVGDEVFNLTAAGAALAVGGTGATTFDYGADFTNSMSVRRGSGTTIVDLEGNYSGANEIFIGARTIVNVSEIALGAGFSYAFQSNAATVGVGQTMTVDGSSVGAGNTFLFDASKDVGGFYDLIGGAGTNTFDFAPYNLFAHDVVQGGSGSGNLLAFKTAGDVLVEQFANVSGISTLKIAAGTNDIQLNDLMVAKASGHALTVNLSTGDDAIDASLLTTTTNAVTINATKASAGDTFIFGATKETVDFGAPPASTSADFDTIANFNFTAGDAVNVAGFTPANALSPVSGSLSSQTFDSDLANALGAGFAAGDAALFHATSGSLAGDTFLIADTNGTAGYAAGDLVLRLTGTTTGALGIANI